MATLEWMLVMRVYMALEQVTIRDTPVGLLLVTLRGQLLCKSEYKLDTSAVDKLCECIIVETGEYWSGGDDAECKPLILQ